MRPTRMTVAGMAALGAVVMAAPAHAGDNNQVYIKQESPAGSTDGNSLTIDQSQAFSSILTGPTDQLVDDARNATPGEYLNAVVPLDRAPMGNTALQRGEGNSATLTITGSGGELQILQDSTPGGVLFLGAGGGNTANATVNGNGLGAIIQVGQLNEANLTLNGDGSSGLISQFGSNLEASLTVQAGGTGQIIQNGNNSNTGMVEVVTGATVTYTQIGNNLQPVGPTGVQVMSTINAGNISITQTGF